MPAGHGAGEAQQASPVPVMTRSRAAGSSTGTRRRSGAGTAPRASAAGWSGVRTPEPSEQPRARRRAGPCRPRRSRGCPRRRGRAPRAGRRGRSAAGPARRDRRAGQVAQLGQRAGLDAPARADDADPVAEPLDLGEDVARQQHGRAAAVAELVDAVLEHLLHQRVEPGGRLVEHQQLHVGATAPRPAPPSAGCPWSRRGPSWSGRARTARAARVAGRSSRPAAHPPEQVDHLARRSGWATGSRRPARRRAAGAARRPRRHGSPPNSRTSPASLRSSPSRTRIVVDLPAPLGPRKPCTSPPATVRSSPSRARVVPNVLTSPRISMTRFAHADARLHTSSVISEIIQNHSCVDPEQRDRLRRAARRRPHRPQVCRPLPSRIFAALLVDDDGRMTAAEIGRDARGEPGRGLRCGQVPRRQLGMIRRERERGSRRDVYVVDDDAWHGTMLQRPPLRPDAPALQRGHRRPGARRPGVPPARGLRASSCGSSSTSCTACNDRWTARRGSGTSRAEAPGSVRDMQ